MHREKPRRIASFLAGIALLVALASCSGAPAASGPAGWFADGGAASVLLERIDASAQSQSGANALPADASPEDFKRLWLESAFPAAARLGILAVGALLCLALYLPKPHFREFLAFSLYAACLASIGALRDRAFLPFSFPVGIAIGRALLAAAALHAAALLKLSADLYPGIMARKRRRLLYALSFAALLASATPLIPYRVAFLIQAALLALPYTALAAGILALARKGERGARLFAATLAIAGGLSLLRSLPESWAPARSLADYAGILLLLGASLSAFLRRTDDACIDADLRNELAEATESSAQRFIPKEFLDQLKKGAVSELKLGDHVSRVMTIFFSDIRSFTELSEKLTPEENFRFVNSYLARMVPVIKERGGFVDKYIGDAIMALFPGEHASDDAVGTAVEMQRRVIEYNRHRASVGYSPIAMGVGLHTGDLMLGVVGVDDRMENTVVSDAVNLASRLQAIAKAFNLGIVISEQCFKTLSDPGAYHYRFIGKVRVKGKAAPVSVFEILDGLDEASFDRKMRANTYFEQGMLAYYGKDYPAAMFHFRGALELIPEDGAVRFYMETCMNKSRQ